MKLILSTNIGTEDNKRLNLDKTHEGDSIDVNQTVADYLLKRGWATAPPKPETLKADPPQAEIQTSGGLTLPPKTKNNG